MKKQIILIGTLFLALCIHNAMAQDSTNYNLPNKLTDNSFQISDLINKMKDCVKEPNPQKRLDCYDNSAISIGLVGSSTNTNDQLYSWDLQTSTSSLGQSQAVIGMRSTIYRDSAFDISKKQTKYADFVVSCLNGDTSFYLQFPDKIFPNPQMLSLTYSIGDSNLPLSIQFLPSSSETAIGLWTKNDVSSFIGNILFAKNISFNIPYDNGTQQIILNFDIEGLSKALDPIRDACSWSGKN
jgi:hypothetical protein